MDTQGVEFYMPSGSVALRITHPLLLTSCTSTVHLIQVVWAQPSGEDLKLSSVESPY
jgi:hypothetical protein